MNFVLGTIRSRLILGFSVVVALLIVAGSVGRAAISGVSSEMGSAVHIFRKAFDAAGRLCEYPFLGGSNRKGGSTIQYGKP